MGEGRGEGFTGFLCGSLRGRDNLEEQLRWEDNIKMHF
jgi:hypothetical protein